MIVSTGYFSERDPIEIRTKKKSTKCIILQHGDVDTKEVLKVKLDDAEFAVAAKGIENMGSSTESRRYLARAKELRF